MEAYILTKEGSRQDEDNIEPQRQLCPSVAEERSRAVQEKGTISITWGVLGSEIGEVFDNDNQNKNLE
jgi:hypothetical protein